MPQRTATSRGRLDLPELLEMRARTAFADGFTHASEGGARASGVATSLCAVLLAEACNTGFEPLIRRDNPALRRSRLNWVQKNYIRAGPMPPWSPPKTTFRSLAPGAGAGATSYPRTGFASIARGELRPLRDSLNVDDES
jgi:hypothetical protein